MARSKLSICALVPYPPNTTPSQRFRIEQWIADLAQQNIDVKVLPFADAELMEVLHQPGQYLTKSRVFTKTLAQRVTHLLAAT